MITWHISRGFFAKLALCTFIAAISATQAAAVTIGNAIQTRVGFDVSGVDMRSYDGPDYNAFAPFLTFTDGMLYSVNSFTGAASGSKLQFFLVSEAACFDGRNPAIANDFGIINSMGDFISAIDSATVDPVGMGMLNQGSNEQFTLALNSPEGLLSSIDANNPGSRAHILLMQATQNANVVINQPLTRPSGPVNFNLLAGDYILFIEDMIFDNNNTFGGMIPLAGDFDYNDMVIVLRNTPNPVPEPSTMLLMACGGLALSRVRRKKRR